MSSYNDTLAAVRRWTSAQQSVESAKSRLSSVECDLMNATNELGKLLAPPDMEDGETICVWVRMDDKRERLLEITRKSWADYNIRFRKKSQRERKAS